MEVNRLLCASRERVASRSAPGAWASRQQIAAAVNTSLLWWEAGHRYEVDALGRAATALSSIGTFDALSLAAEAALFCQSDPRGSGWRLSRL